MFKNFDWMILIIKIFVVICVYIIVFSLVMAFKESQREIDKKNQCTTACHPYAVMSSEDKYCQCAISSTVLWRKDIK